MRWRSDQRSSRADERRPGSFRRAHDVPVVEHRSVVGAIRGREIAVGEGRSEKLWMLAQLVGDGAIAEQEFTVRRARVDEDAASIAAQLDGKDQDARFALPARGRRRVAVRSWEPADLLQVSGLVHIAPEAAVRFLREI